MINFHILGAGGAVPTPSHTPAAYWVTVDQDPILMDPGPGALVRLVKSGAAPRGVDHIDRVLLTHLHPDHSADLVPLLFALHSPVPLSTTEFQIFGPPGLLRLLDQFRAIYGRWLDPRLRKLTVQEIEPGFKLDLPGGGNIQAFGVNHPQDRLSEACLGYRFTDRQGRSAVFSGDTGPSPELEEAAAGCDLLVIECSTPDELATPGHLCPRDVGQICNRARPGQVVLTHQYPAAAEMDLIAALGQYYQGQVIQAVDGTVVTVGRPSEEDSES